MNRPVVVAVHLGCCPDEPRCALCAPHRAPEPDTIAALVEAYRRDRGHGRELTVAFFGGAPPTDAQLDAIEGLPFTARVRPDLLARADVERLIARGGTGFELDALTFDDELLRFAGRRYRGELVDRIADALEGRARRVGVLAPGLPGSTFDHALRDAVRACERFDAVRLHPVLVVEGSRLGRLFAAGTYRPLSIPDAVTTCRAMMDVLEANGVEVIRVGMQPGPDEVGRVIGGPVHSSLRELVEARRTLDRLRGLLEGVPAGAVVAVRVAPADETRARGPLNQTVRTLRAEFGFAEIAITVDPELARGAIDVVWAPGVPS